jgi:hypothetical protein
MTASIQHAQDQDIQQSAGAALNAVIGEQVLHRLGEPDDLKALHVRKLWEAHYRVNVFTGADRLSATIARSYFLTTDTEGNIVKSSPEITRQY